MIADIINVAENDTVMIHHNIGNMPPGDVDKYCTRLATKLASIFGKGRVALFPIREGASWEFTIVKKPSKKKL